MEEQDADDGVLDLHTQFCRDLEADIPGLVIQPYEELVLFDLFRKEDARCALHLLCPVSFGNHCLCGHPLALILC
jgi:hypothetical protein